MDPLQKRRDQDAEAKLELVSKDTPSSSSSAPEPHHGAPCHPVDASSVPKPGVGGVRLGFTGGLVMYALSTVFVTLMASIAKLLTESGLSVFEVVFARSAFLLFCSAALVWHTGLDPLGNNRCLLLVRGTMGFLNVTCIYATVSMLPLGEATVLSFLAPLWVALLSQVVLGERPSKWHLISIPICLLGVVLVAKPGIITSLLHWVDEAFEIGLDEDDFASRPTSQGVTGSDTVGAPAGGNLTDGAAPLPTSAGTMALGLVFGLGQGFFNAGAKMSVRALRHSDDDRVMMLYLGAISTAASGLACLVLPSQRWSAPRTPLLGFLLVIGVGMAGLGNQYCFTTGMRFAPSATAAMSLSYLSLVWAFALGLAFFHEWPLGTEWAGTALIVVSMLGAAYMDERSRARKPLASDASSSAPASEQQGNPKGGTPPEGVPAGAKGGAPEEDDRTPLLAPQSEHHPSGLAPVVAGRPAEVALVTGVAAEGRLLTLTQPTLRLASPQQAA